MVAPWADLAAARDARSLGIIRGLVSAANPPSLSLSLSPSAADTPDHQSLPEAGDQPVSLALGARCAAGSIATLLHAITNVEANRCHLGERLTFSAKISPRKGAKRLRSFPNDRSESWVSRGSQGNTARPVRSFTYLFKIFIRGDKVTCGHAWLHSSRRARGFYGDTATNYLDPEHL